jgi:hypothetical protein
MVWTLLHIGQSIIRRASFSSTTTDSLVVSDLEKRCPQSNTRIFILLMLLIVVESLQLIDQIHDVGNLPESFPIAQTASLPKLYLRSARVPEAG